MTRWILIRHGESTANADAVLAGHLDVPLTARGEAQARALAAELAAERIGRVVSSDLRRAFDTARLAMAGRAWGIRATPTLRERDVGAWSGVPTAEIARQGGKAVMQSLHGRPPGGEALADVAARALATLDVLDDGRPTMVVCHGGLLRAIWSLHLGDVPPDAVGRLPMPNARPLILDLPRGRWGDLRRGLLGG